MTKYTPNQDDTVPTKYDEESGDDIPPSINSNSGAASLAGISGSLTGPEAIAMLFCAGAIDLLGYILLFAGLDDFGILDIIGMIFIGLWMFTRTGKKNLLSAKFKRFGFASAVEMIPYIGSLSPSWTIAVFLELKNG